MDRILSFSQREGLLPDGGLIVCALSGGRDSVALLHFLKDHGFAVAAAHFDHRLRPDSGKDAEFCRGLCERWDIPFYQGEGDVAAMAGNTEANARTARYAFLEETAERTGAAVIATAHNADDNLETILLHLTRGCGLNGLTGIRSRRGRVVRPMLQVPRAVIDGYVEKHGLPFVEDSTNADTAFARNRIRHQVMPVLRSINPRVAEVSSFMAETLREDLRFLQDHGGRETSVPERTYPPLETMQVPFEGTVDTPLWSLTTRLTACTPDAPPTPNAFYLRLPRRLVLRARETGDAIHPPFRTGKTVKKWLNELHIPVGEREATPVLTDGAAVLAVAGIGPSRDWLAQPGRKSLFVQWTKKREEPDT